MKRLVLTSLIFSCTLMNAQETAVKEFFNKYFFALNRWKHYSDWTTRLDENSAITKYEFLNPELNDSIYINYKISKYPLIPDDSTKAFLSYKLRVNVDTISNRIIDSVFLVQLFFIYGHGKIARQKMNDNFKLIIKEASCFDKEYKTYGRYNDNYYSGYSYDLRSRPAFPYTLNITWTKNKSKEYILWLSYLIHYKNKE